MGSDRDQANNVLFISFASFLFFSFYSPLCFPPSSVSLPLRWTVESTVESSFKNVFGFLISLQFYLRLFPTLSDRRDKKKEKDILLFPAQSLKKSIKFLKSSVKPVTTALIFINLTPILILRLIRMKRSKRKK